MAPRGSLARLFHIGGGLLFGRHVSERVRSPRGHGWREGRVPHGSKLHSSAVAVGLNHVERLPLTGLLVSAAGPSRTMGGGDPGGGGGGGGGILLLRTYGHSIQAASTACRGRLHCVALYRLLPCTRGRRRRGVRGGCIRGRGEAWVKKRRTTASATLATTVFRFAAPSRPPPAFLLLLLST